MHRTLILAGLLMAANGFSAPLAFAQDAGGTPPAARPSPGTPKEESVPFSVRNGSLLPRKIEIAGNVLDFGPFEVRYVGFPSGTKAYAYEAGAPDKRGKLLFTVGEDIRDKRIGL